MLLYCLTEMEELLGITSLLEILTQRSQHLPMYLETHTILLQKVDVTT